MEKKRYAKAFYDDGLGDILEWIDDEVLVNDTKEKSSAKKSTSSKKSSKQSRGCSDEESDYPLKHKKSIESKRAKLYGENDLEKVLNKKTRANIDKSVIEFDEASISGDRQKNDKNLEDRTRGLINRLAAQTMGYVSGEFQKLYSTQSRPDLNQAIYDNIERSVLMKASVAKRKLVAELMMLVSYLDSTISHNIGATIVHTLIKQFELLYRDGSGDKDKRMDNIVFCLMNLFSTGLISANIVFELTKRICSPEDFRPKSVELLLIILKNIGFQLRKENPSLMRQLILMSTEQCKSLKSAKFELDNRIEFIMEALNAIKNNNMSKIGNYGCDIDRETIESTLKGLLKRTKVPESLSDATFNDIILSCNWYLLETRVDETNNLKVEESKGEKAKGKSSKSEMKICKALGLNKPSERTIFSSLIKVSDFVEASNIIIGYGLNHCSDAMVVVLHVSIHEKKYNPFYFNLINNLCKFNRKYKMAAKFAMQDKIRVLSDMSSQKVGLMSKLCFELIKSDAIPITVLKSIEWANLNDSTRQFLVTVLSSVAALGDEEKRQILLKSDKKSSFAGAMRTFTNCFIKDCKLFE